MQSCETYVSVPNDSYIAAKFVVKNPHYLKNLSSVKAKLRAKNKTRYRKLSESRISKTNISRVCYATRRSKFRSLICSTILPIQIYRSTSSLSLKGSKIGSNLREYAIEIGINTNAVAVFKKPALF